MPAVQPSANPADDPADECLMLKIRCEALERNLKKLQTFLEAIPNRVKELTELYNVLGKFHDLVNDAATPLYTAKNDFEALSYRAAQALRAANRDSINDVMGRISSLANAVSEGWKKIEEAKEGITKTIDNVNEMSSRCFRIEKNDQIGERLTEDLNQRIEPCLTSLTRIEKQLETNNAVLTPLWDDYRQINDKSQAIFSEYVDFLGGWALRDARFDSGISQVAEELLQTYKTEKYSLRPRLALPARQHAVAKTLARIIRVGFPEWTIWALPFVAHEFWHVVAKDDLDSRLRSAFADLNKGEPEPIEDRYQICLADGFATFNMGPAYAYSAFFLSLNPKGAYLADHAAGHSSVGDDTRAKAILEMLCRMGKKGSGGNKPPYQGVIDRLSAMWDSSVGDIGGEHITETSNHDPAQILIVMEALWNVLQESSYPGFLISHWKAVSDEEFQKNLVAGKLDALKLPDGFELRDVLNAVWHARVDSNAQPGIDWTKLAEDLRAMIKLPERRDRSAGKSAQGPNVGRELTRR